VIEGIFYIESQGGNEKAVKKALEELVQKMKAEKGVEIKKATFGKMIEEKGNYSFTVDVDVSFETLKSYLMTAMKFGPSAITLESPQKMRFPKKEFLTVIGEISAFTKRLMNKHGLQFKATDVEEQINVGLEADEIEGLLDQGAIRAKIVVESGKDEEEAKKSFLEAISKDVFIHKVHTSKVGEQTLIAVHIFMYEPTTLVEISLRYTPILIQILEPSEIELSLFDLQSIGVELAAAYFEMAHMTIKRPSPS
jgi:hypothetical protein